MLYPLNLARVEVGLNTTKCYIAMFLRLDSRTVNTEAVSDLKAEVCS